MTAFTQLKYIYRAKDCVDVQDADIALAGARELVKTYGHANALRRRVRSLERIKSTFTK